MKGKGSIIVNEKNRFDNAYWVDGLTNKLFSVAQLISFCYRVEFLNKKAKIYDSTGELIGSGKKTRGNLFYLDLSEDTCLSAQYEDVCLWHKRPCHVNFDNLIEISKKIKVRGLPRLSKPDKVMCKQCQLEK